MEANEQPTQQEAPKKESKIAESLVSADKEEEEEEEESEEEVVE